MARPPRLPRALRAFVLAITACAAALPWSAGAGPADIDAAARGVVRVVIVATDEAGQIFPVGHGTGFAVARDMVVTNAHVVQDAAADRALNIGVVPGGGGEAVYGELVRISPGQDLALIRLTGSLRLPPLTLAGGPPPDAGDVTSVGYPSNVDRAQGLELRDILSPQPPVKSRGAISGARPSRQFDSILHTAPIARGNSGGPLLDECGRVLGVNSFGADNEGGDAEFFFAVSDKELIPFLRAAGVTPQISAAPCRSMAELDAAERAEAAREAAAARDELAATDAATRARRERALLEAQTLVAMEREDRLVLAVVLLLAAFACAQAALARRGGAGSGAGGMGRRWAGWALAAAGLTVAALALWLTRPGIAAIDARVAEAMAAARGKPLSAVPAAAATGTRRLLCTLEPERSRITGAPAAQVPLRITAEGCVNGRTQYGFAAGRWSRVFVPADEDAVAVNSFDPERLVYRSERYLLPRARMDAARAARGRYTAPACAAPDAARRLGEQQAETLALLPAQANERLVYRCAAAAGGNP